MKSALYIAIFKNLFPCQQSFVFPISITNYYLPLYWWWILLCFSLETLFEGIFCRISTSQYIFQKYIFSFFVFKLPHSNFLLAIITFGKSGQIFLPLYKHLLSRDCLVKKNTELHGSLKIWDISISGQFITQTLWSDLFWGISSNIATQFSIFHIQLCSFYFWHLF